MCWLPHAVVPRLSPRMCCPQRLELACISRVAQTPPLLSRLQVACLLLPYVPLILPYHMRPWLPRRRPLSSPLSPYVAIGVFVLLHAWFVAAQCEVHREPRQWPLHIAPKHCAPPMKGMCDSDCVGEPFGGMLPIPFLLPHYAP